VPGGEDLFRRHSDAAPPTAGFAEGRDGTLPAVALVLPGRDQVGDRLAVAGDRHRLAELDRTEKLRQERALASVALTSRIAALQATGYF